MLDEEAKDAIRALARSGFYDPEAIMEIVRSEIYEPGEVDETEVSAEVMSEFAKLARESLDWPAVTDCDRLDQAFAALNARGIIATQNAGYTQSDGLDHFQEAYDRHPRKSAVVGYCFYHSQDLEHAVRGEGLYLAFGPVDPEDGDTEGSDVGSIIREEIERVGLDVEWDGTFNERLFVPKIRWQRRQ